MSVVEGDNASRSEHAIDKEKVDHDIIESSEFHRQKRSRASSLRSNAGRAWNDGSPRKSISDPNPAPLKVGEPYGPGHLFPHGPPY